MDDEELDLLAYDIADMLDRNGYDKLDVSASDIRRALPDFIAQITQNAAASDA